MDSITSKIQLVVAFVLLAGLVVFGYFRGTAFYEKYTYIDNLEGAILEASEVIDTLETHLSEAKTEFSSTNDYKNDEIAGVFPATEDLTSLNRAFDEFSVENNFVNSPFFISSISYNESAASEEGNYMALPFSMQIESSEDNFYKFLEYIETSGNLDTKVRLMEVTDVSIDLGSSDDEMLSYTLDLKAYYQL